jgi:hypothetical protein
MISRRRLITSAARVAAATVAAGTFVNAAPVSAPETAPEIAPTSDKTPEIDRTLERLLPSFSPDGLAAQGISISTISWLGSASALVSILQWLGISPSFGERVDYREASQCKGNFAEYERVWQPYYRYFTKVSRAPADLDVAYLVGGNFGSGGNLVQGAGATQYRGYAAVPLYHDDPGVALAAVHLLREQYRLTGQDVADAFAITNKESYHDDGMPISRYETPTISYQHNPVPYRDPNTGVLYGKGLLSLHYKRDRSNPNNLKYAGLYV